MGGCTEVGKTRPSMQMREEFQSGQQGKMREVRERLRFLPSRDAHHRAQPTIPGLPKLAPASLNLLAPSGQTGTLSVRGVTRTPGSTGHVPCLMPTSPGWLPVWVTSGTSQGAGCLGPAVRSKVKEMPRSQP